MRMAEWSDHPISKDTNDDYRYFLLLKQEAEYEKIRDRSNRILGFVLSVVSLVASFGAIRYIFSGGFRPTTVGIPTEIANICSPDTVFHSSVVVNFDGAYFSIATNLLILTLVLVVEMFYCNWKLQHMPSLGPQTRSKPENKTKNWLGINQQRIDEARLMSNAIVRRLQYAIAFTVLSGITFIGVFQNWALTLLLLNILSVTFGGILLIRWGRGVLSGWNSESGWLLLKDTSVSPIFWVVSFLSWCWLIYFHYNLLQVLLAFANC